MRLSNEQKVYKFLREYNGSTLNEIFIGLKGEIIEGDILQILYRGHEKGYIEIKPKSTLNKDTFILKFVLTPVRRVPSDGFWNYSDLHMPTKVIGSDEVEILPKRGDKIMARSQGNVGACCGAAGSSLMDDIHMALCPEDSPTEEDKAEYRHNVPFSEGSEFYYDKTWPQSFSLAGLYWRSKILGNVPGQGSYIDLILKVLVEEGAGRDWQWIHMKDGKSAFKEPYPDLDPKTGEKYFETAKEHKIDGFARCSTTLSMINALLDHDDIGLPAAMEIAEGTFNSAKGNGIWDIWKGESLGGHAILIKGRKKRGSKWGWIFFNSWEDEGYPREEWMSDDYWRRAKIDCFVALDSEESSFIRDNVRQKVIIITNAPAKIYIDGTFHGDTKDNKLSAQLQKEKEYTLEARKVSNPLKKVSKKVKITPDIVEVQLFFDDDTTPTKPGLSEIIAALIEKLKKLFNKK